MDFHQTESLNQRKNSLRARVGGNCYKLETFLQGYVISLCAVVVRQRARVLLSILSFFPPFFVLLFCINIYLNNCYLIKCNKQQEKISCFQKKDSTPLLNIYIDNLNFYPHFLQFIVGRPGLITI